ncbi:hypothetical protein F383_14533 [Gossypium arboreum]|uniref:Uncharacterized protein n=1 Tax=Gossypium arboreum TaxID=29729 RepID=A0A0B0NFJ2_GOSAR|nr:hypothetical protein F383_14533 [Gossypium arboreum]
MLLNCLCFLFVYYLHYRVTLFEAKCVNFAITFMKL